MTPRVYNIGDWMHCQKCNHDWRLRRPKYPEHCPKCKNYNWDEGPKQDGMGRPPKEK